jgi:cytochrome c
MKLLLTLALSVLLAGCVSAPQEAPAPEPQVSVEQGKVIFNDPKLGTTGATCNTCHPNGGTIGGKVMDMPIPDLHGSAVTFPKFKEWAGKEITLSEMNNFCITQILKGQPLGVDSAEMQSMNAYLQTLEGTPTSAPGYK